MKLRMDGQSTLGNFFITNVNMATNNLDLLLERVYPVENGVAIHQFAFIKV